MSEKHSDPLEKRLKTLEGKISAQKEQHREATDVKPDKSGLAVAMKMSSEFIAATLVGAAIGWGIDWVLGISPWGMIIMLMLGFVAGIRNVMRSADQMAISSSEENGSEGGEPENKAD